ncbi:FAD-dependent oxidoreductase [Streptomyces sp. DG2A-72]|uniref:FAD-dependent oxidoreductase n=1 Tax=Streptomyces sp. DG2A-72 TaxID=3051386 RepID=UPI003463B5CA
MTVVGAGPVGLVLAAELALCGATVQILERRAEPDEAVKAQSINLPTAEALDRRGLLPAARRCSGNCSTAWDRSPARPTTHHPVAAGARPRHGSPGTSRE